MCRRCHGAERQARTGPLLWCGATETKVCCGVGSCSGPTRWCMKGRYQGGLERWLLGCEGSRHIWLGQGSEASGAGVAAGPHCFFSLITGKGRTGVAVRGLGSSPALGTSSVTLISVWSSSNIGSIIWGSNEEATVRLPAKLGNGEGGSKCSLSCKLQNQHKTDQSRDVPCYFKEAE